MSEGKDTNIKFIIKGNNNEQAGTQISIYD